jgi:uncharacterized protein (DUF58 family)
MKSVTAAQVAAVGAWRVLDQGDRVGAVVFNDVVVREVRAHRSERTATRILSDLVELNRALRVDSEVTADPAALNRVLETVVRTAKHDTLVAIVSDFDGVDARTTELVSRLARHNDVLAVPVYDPMSTREPARRRLVVSDVELQVEIRGERADVRRRFSEFADARIAEVLAWQRKLGVPVLPISTDRDVLEQLRELLGVRSPAPGRRR